MWLRLKMPLSRPSKTQSRPPSRDLLGIGEVPDQVRDCGRTSEAMTSVLQTIAPGPVLAQYPTKHNAKDPPCPTRISS